MSINTSRRLKSFVFFCSVFITFGNSKADTPSYLSAAEATIYFETKEHIAVLVRVSGGISFGEYKSMLNEFNSEIDEDDRVEIWEDDVNAYDSSDFVVLKNLKGELNNVIQMPHDYANAFRLGLGQPYLVFLDASPSNVYTLETGEAYMATNFTRDVLNSSPDDLIEYLVNRLFGEGE